MLCHVRLCALLRSVQTCSQLTGGCVLQVSLALPSVQGNLGPGYTYLIFAAVGVVAVAVIYTTVPETKGRTLEEIERSWIDGDKSS